MDSASTKNKIDQFFSMYKKVTFQTGDTILSPQKETQQIYFILSGSVKMYSLSEDGEEIILHIFREGAFFPFMLFLSETKNLYYYQAAGEVEVAVAPAEKVKEFVFFDSEVITDLAVRFSKAISGLLTRIEGLAFQDAYTKVVSLFIYLAEKFGQKTENGVVIPLDLTHQDIAAWVSVRRETASRQLERMAQNGLIRTEEHRYVISDPQMLKNHLTHKAT